MHQELEEMSADIKRADAEDAAFAQEMTASLARIGQMFHAALHPEEPS
jgi:hypothetical protein